ncbi:MAG: helix-turn-helix transcriptional regulator [Candidatus Omnitrophica bacterium]|nr:helix-turn-helix transcriptional regulator [Candidatus Omnitrophota bacterium]
MKTQDFNQLLKSLDEARVIRAGQCKPSRVIIFNPEKRRSASFRECYELDEEKLKVAKVIIAERIRRRFTQAALARRLGVTQQQISKIENGEFDNLATIQHVLAMLGYHVRVSAVPLPPCDSQTAAESVRMP